MLDGTRDHQCASLPREILATEHVRLLVTCLVDVPMVWTRRTAVNVDGSFG